MRHVSWVVACALACAGGVVACGLYPDESEKKDNKEQVKKLMTALHKGDKSPLARTGAELKKESPDWDQLAKDAKAFTEMSDLLKKNREGYRSPEKYISSAAELTKAAKDKDLKAATAAFTGLSQSCAACHFYGPPK